MLRITLYQSDILLLLFFVIYDREQRCKTYNRIQRCTYLMVHISNQCRFQPIGFFCFLFSCGQFFFHNLSPGNGHQRSLYSQQSAIFINFPGNGMHFQPLQYESLSLFSPETKFDHHFLHFAFQYPPTSFNHPKAVFLIDTLINTRYRNRKRIIMKNLPSCRIVRRTGIKPYHMLCQFPLPWKNFRDPKRH